MSDRAWSRALTGWARINIEAARGLGRGGEPLLAGDPRWTSPAATFVTLTRGGDLRGCIGTIEPYRDLRADVAGNARAAALEDPRFMPLEPDELSDLEVEVSVLTHPEPLAHQGGADLLGKLRPGVDGVILRQGGRGATFLPQVWHQIPGPAEFLTHLCLKAGLRGNAWRDPDLRVWLYRVEAHHEG